MKKHNYKPDTEDALDEIFIETFNEKFGQWQWKPIKGSFLRWLNTWGDEDKHTKYQQEEEQLAFRRGYSQAIRDIYDKLKINFKVFDKRTKIGFKQELSGGKE